MRFSFCFIAACAIAASWPQSARSQATPPRACATEADQLVTCVKPSDTDRAIRRFDEFHYVLLNPRPAPNAQLLVFLTGTGGEPPGPLSFLKAAAAAGYRVISLAYNDTPAVAVYCPRKPDAACSEKFRRMRIYGDGTTVDPAIDNPPAESIVNRLVKLLQYLDRLEPQRGWGAYLENGAPAWGRLVFAGQSQGAGMAAFIAKQHALARVILFSSPWDFVARGNGRQLAPWLALPSVTPPDRWYGGYHARENMAVLLAKSYAELRIPSDHIRVFDLDLPPARQKQGGDNPYHGQGISNPAYAEQRAFFLGHSL